MPRNNLTTRDTSQSGSEIRAATERRQTDVSTISASSTGRVVVTRQQSGEVKLRYAPRDVGSLGPSTSTTD